MKKAFFKKEDGELLPIKSRKVILKLSLSKKERWICTKLFDLTGLQVYCNTKFGFTADETKIVQTLYEQK
jgi:DNA topoisomerase-3